MNIIWLPTEDHVWFERVISPYVGQLHWWHSFEHLALNADVILIFCELFLRRRLFLLAIAEVAIYETRIS